MVDPNTMDELLHQPIENTGRWIAFGAIGLTLILLVLWGMLKDLPGFKQSFVSVKKKTLRARLVRKYVLSEDDMEENRKNATGMGLHSTGLHYMALFSAEGLKRPIALEMKSGQWAELPENGEGILEYSGNLLVLFTPNK